MSRLAYPSRSRPLAAVWLLALLLLSSSACANRQFDALMRSWEGHSLPDLLRTWGPPDFFYVDGQGGRVAVYVPVSPGRPSRTSAEAERLRAASSARVYEPTMKASWPTFRMFFADSTGRIARSEWRGNWECCDR